MIARIRGIAPPLDHPLVDAALTPPRWNGRPPTRRPAARSRSRQFFLTLDACQWLDGKHTIFGKVSGNTIFNLLRMGQMDVDEDTDRPSEPIELKTVEVCAVRSLRGQKPPPPRAPPRASFRAQRRGGGRRAKWRRQCGGEGGGRVGRRVK